MAIVVEDGSGKTDAESYISLADAETYLDDRGLNTTAWDALADGAKEEALRVATEHIDAEAYHLWQGVKADSTNALAWPRYDAYEHSYLIDGDEIPTNLKRACAEFALLASAETLAPDVATPGSLKGKTVQVGPIRISRTWASGGKDSKQFRKAWRLLSGLLTRGNRVVRA